MYQEVKNTLLTALLAAGSIAMQASDLRVDSLRITSPYCMNTPIRTDSTDVWGKAFQQEDLMMDAPMQLNQWLKGECMADSIVPASEKGGVRLAGFQMENSMFAKCRLNITSTARHKTFIDGKEYRDGDERQMLPGRHDVVVKLLQKPGKADTLTVSVQTSQEKYLTLNPKGKRLYTFEDYQNGLWAGGTSLSAGGRFMKYSTRITKEGGEQQSSERILDLKTGHEYVPANFVQWAAKGDCYIAWRQNSKGETTYEYTDPATGKGTPFFTDAQGLWGEWTAQDKLLLINKSTEGPRDDAQVHQILEPDDRIAGWRNRNNVQLLDPATQQVSVLTQGQHNTYASVSDDGKHIILSVRENDITTRPFSFTTLLLLDRETMQVDTLVHHDGFVNSAQWLPDNRHILIQGSPEALGGIGKNDPTGKIPSIIQQELYLMDTQSKEITPLTRDFDPCIISVQCSRTDGNIYALCENRDLKSIFKMDLKTRRWTQLKLTECYVSSFSLADEKPLLSYSGEGASNTYRIYTVDLKSGKETLIRDYNPERMGDIELGEFGDWNFKSSRGDTIYGRYYLPPHFDANKKYPMLVYYYGGCSPTGRYLDSYYNYHNWAAMGYVVYVIQPSGCTGFGQEFAARHVNAYGKYTADDIIEGTKKFCSEHPYVNDKKIGCLGASYGGFMTMYLQTVTDIFAAAMAHAGISNPASYWGFGYWGYSYSAISAANSYPWNNPQLMSEGSPLFNADKVHTPILFLHGGSDTNVPIAESTQMFNALKILGRECAFVTVEGQDHHILDYAKQTKWVHTYYAWFAKYLQDDPTWWESLYPTKNIK